MSNVADPARYGAVVTPSNTVNLIAPTRGLFIGTAGNLSVEMSNGTVAFTGVPVGVFPIQCTRVNSTGTTASNIIALW
jgi:hypothetical protein